MTKLAVIYYSATGHGTTMARKSAYATSPKPTTPLPSHTIPPGPATTTQPRTSPPQVETTSCGPTP
jgi:hypothetical protein